MKHSYLGLDNNIAESRILENEMELEHTLNVVKQELKDKISNIDNNIVSGTVNDTKLFNGKTPDFYLNRENHIGTQLSSSISDFQTAVSNNTDVVANTNARHIHDNKSILDLIEEPYTTAEKNKLAGIEDGADVTATHKSADTAAIQGISVSTVAPTDGQVLMFDGTNNEYSPNNITGFVDLSNNQSIDGVKTFIQFPEKYWDGTSAYPQPTAPMQFATKLYVDKLRPYTMILGQPGEAGNDYDDINDPELRSRLAAGNEILFIRSGTYVLTSNLQIGPNVKIIGENKYTTIIDVAAVSAYYLWSYDENIYIQNLTIRGSVASTSYTGLKFIVSSAKGYGVSNVYIEDCIFQEFYIALSTSNRDENSTVYYQINHDNIHIKNCDFYTSVKTISGYSTIHLYLVTVEGVYVDNCIANTNAAIFLRGTVLNTVFVRDNVIKYETAPTKEYDGPFYLFIASDLHISGNKFDLAGAGSAIFLQQRYYTQWAAYATSQDNVIQNNKFVNAAHAITILIESTDVAIKYNKIDNNLFKVSGVAIYDYSSAAPQNFVSNRVSDNLIVGATGIASTTIDTTTNQIIDNYEVS